MKLDQRLKTALDRMNFDGFDGWFTPAQLTEQLSKFSASIGADTLVQAVPVAPFDGMMTRQCFNNCIHLVGVMGGEVVYGWAWHQIHDLLVVAEFHAVWRAPDGQLIDITPPLLARQTTTFSIDPVRVAADVLPSEAYKSGEPNRRFALRDIEDVHEWICAEDANAAMNRRCIEAGKKIPVAEAVPVLERHANARARIITRLRRQQRK